MPLNSHLPSRRINNCKSIITVRFRRRNLVRRMYEFGVNNFLEINVAISISYATLDAPRVFSAYVFLLRRPSVGLLHVSWTQSAPLCQRLSVCLSLCLVNRAWTLPPRPSITGRRPVVTFGQGDNAPACDCQVAQTGQLLAWGLIGGHRRA